MKKNNYYSIHKNKIKVNMSKVIRRTMDKLFLSMLQNKKSADLYFIIMDNRIKKQINKYKNESK